MELHIIFPSNGYKTSKTFSAEFAHDPPSVPIGGLGLLPVRNLLKKINLMEDTKEQQTKVAPDEQKSTKRELISCQRFHGVPGL